MPTLRHILMLIVISFTTHTASAVEPQLAADALKRAVTFYREQVSCQGTYLWRYSADFTLREGEVEASEKTGWVQPPGTPSVGEAYLTAYEATRDPFYLDAAKETAQGLIMGQLRSGGWDYRIEFDDAVRKKFAYRVSPNKPDGTNTSTLDDNTTQSALKFMMRIDKVLAFADPNIHEACTYALDALLAAQYPNGAWPQRFHAPPVAADFPVLKASYPETWNREYVKIDYQGFYTFNDGAMRDMVRLMLDAHDIYGDARYKNAAIKAGDFMLLAQMPEPQPGWAQQYDRDMHPAWARKFEPPAICGSESQGVMLTLLELSGRTGEKRFLDAVAPALAYYRRSLLPDGRLARFYELQTNKPLFFTKEYVLTYASDDVPTHYSFFSGANLDQLESIYTMLTRGESVAWNEKSTAPTETTIKNIVEQLDPRGAWVEKGTLRAHKEVNTIEIIDSAVFCQKVSALSGYIAANAPPNQ